MTPGASRTLLAGLTLALVMTGHTLLAAEAELEPTQLLVASCYGCHALPTGNRVNGLLPAINRRDAHVLQQQLFAFKNGELPSTVMNRIARGYTNEQLTRMAQWLSEP